VIAGSYHLHERCQVARWLGSQDPLLDRRSGAGHVCASLATAGVRVTGAWDPHGVSESW
jgi:hypothetical protein